VCALGSGSAIDIPERPVFVTWRLWGSLPQERSFLCLGISAAVRLPRIGTSMGGDPQRFLDYRFGNGDFNVTSRQAKRKIAQRWQSAWLSFGCSERSFVAPRLLGQNP